MNGPKLGALILGVPGAICIGSQVFRINASWLIFGIGLLLVVFAMLIAIDDGGRRG